jgi:hypothetical protein
VPLFSANQSVPALVVLRIIPPPPTSYPVFASMKYIEEPEFDDWFVQFAPASVVLKIYGQFIISLKTIFKICCVKICDNRFYNIFHYCICLAYITKDINIF